MLNHLLFGQANTTLNSIPYKKVESAYFAHNYINEVSYFTFHSLEEFAGKIGFACMGNCEKDLKTALSEKDFENNIALVIVYPNVAPESRLEIVNIVAMDEEKILVNYNFKAGKASSFIINALQIVLLDKKYAKLPIAFMAGDK